MTDVTVVIPNWNGRRHLPAALASLRSQSSAPARILVVDNGSTDGSDSMAAGAGAEVLKLKQNLGFAAAVNEGIRQTTTPLVSIFNNDAEAEPGWLSALTAVLAQHPEKWFACGKIVRASDPGTIDGCFDAVCVGRTAWRCGNGRPDGPVWNRPCEISVAPLTAALLRRDLFDRVGLLDERFESYLEDTDFGIRCAVAGCGGLYEPAAVARHWGSATLGVWHSETVRRIARNQVYLARKHPPVAWMSRAGWSIVAAQLLWGLVALKHGAAVPYVWGKIQGIFARPGWGPNFEKERTDSILRREQERIRQLQAEAGGDRYWRAYFALT